MHNHAGLAQSVRCVAINQYHAIIASDAQPINVYTPQTLLQLRVASGSLVPQARGLLLLAEQLVVIRAEMTMRRRRGPEEVMIQ
jgi:hypothetical protein